MYGIGLLSYRIRGPRRGPLNTSKSCAFQQYLHGLMRDERAALRPAYSVRYGEEQCTHIYVNLAAGSFGAGSSSVRTTLRLVVQYVWKLTYYRIEYAGRDAAR